MIELIIRGNLTADPVLNDREYINKETGEVIKTKVCNFTVAANDGFGERRMTQYFRINAWRGLGETCSKYLTKGRGVTVKGVVSLNNYVDKNNNLRASMEVRADGVEFDNDGKNSELPEEEEEALY